MQQMIPLPDFEVDILNKVAGTRTFGEFHDMKAAFQQQVEDQKEQLIKEGAVAQHDFPLYKTQVVNNIIQFLLRNEFYSLREGGVYFLTEKGRLLQKQGTLQKYVDWQLQREDKLLKDMHTIEERGYLDEDQTFKKNHRPEPIAPMEEESKKNFGWYILIIIVLIVLAAIGKSHKWW